MNLGGPKAGNFLTHCVTISFSRRILLQLVKCNIGSFCVSVQAISLKQWLINVYTHTHKTNFIVHYQYSINLLKPTGYLLPQQV